VRGKPLSIKGAYTTAAAQYRKTRLYRGSAIGEDLLLTPVPQGTDAKAGGKAILLNMVAHRVWALLDKPQSAAQLANSIVAEFDVGRMQAENDVARTLQVMEKWGIVETVYDAGDFVSPQQADRDDAPHDETSDLP